MSRFYDHGGTIFTVARTRGVLPEQLLDFSASINPLGMSQLVRTALINSIDMLVYYPDASHFELKRVLAEYHDLPPDNFTIANGSTELIYHLPGLIPGSKALLISPSFSEYAKALDQHQWQTEHFVLTPENNFAIDLEKLQRALVDGVDALFIGNPGNPSGTLYTQQVIEDVYALCRAAGTFLVLDEAFMDFSEEASAKQMIVQSDNALILRSMTKFFAIPGLRLGYALCNETLAERLNSMGGPWSVNTMALAAGVAALQDVQHNRESLDYINKERDVLIESLGRFPSLKLYPSSANYLLVEIVEGMTARELKDTLLLHNILIRDCASFTGLSERFFRVAVRSSEENKRLVECIGCELL
jgi:threonine-phosphate decarboxylase